MKKLAISEMNRLSPDEFRNSKKIPIIVILDNIRSLHNVGSVFRTSDAFRIENIILCGLTCVPPHLEIHNAALGAAYSVEWSYSKDIVVAIENLKVKSYSVFAVEQTHGSTKLNDFKIDVNRKYAIVFGNEVRGVQQEVVDLCDSCIEIPQFGTKHSLNVSVAAGIVIWHFFNSFYPSLEF